MTCHRWHHHSTSNDMIIGYHLTYKVWHLLIFVVWLFVLCLCLWWRQCGKLRRMGTHPLSFNSFTPLRNVWMLVIPVLVVEMSDWKRRKKERNVSGDKTIFLERMEERKEERKWMCMKESEVEESRERHRTSDQGKRRKEMKEKGKERKQHRDRDNR